MIFSKNLHMHFNGLFSWLEKLYNFLLLFFVRWNLIFWQKGKCAKAKPTHTHCKIHTEIDHSYFGSFLVGGSEPQFLATFRSSNKNGWEEMKVVFPNALLTFWIETQENLWSELKRTVHIHKPKNIRSYKCLYTHCMVHFCS